MSSVVSSVCKSRACRFGQFGRQFAIVTCVTRNGHVCQSLNLLIVLQTKQTYRALACRAAAEVNYRVRAESGESRIGEECSVGHVKGKGSD